MSSKNLSAVFYVQSSTLSELLALVSITGKTPAEILSTAIFTDIVVGAMKQLDSPIYYKTPSGDAKPVQWEYFEPQTCADETRQKITIPLTPKMDEYISAHYNDISAPNFVIDRAIRREAFFENLERRGVEFYTNPTGDREHRLRFA